MPNTPRPKCQDLAKEVDSLKSRLAALDRVDRNPLYRESLEDQRARQLRAASNLMTGIEFMGQALRDLSPEMFSRFKRDRSG